jgi:hypothetical protein
MVFFQNQKMDVFHPCFECKKSIWCLTYQNQDQDQDQKQVDLTLLGSFCPCLQRGQLYFDSEQGKTHTSSVYFCSMRCRTKYNQKFPIWGDNEKDSDDEQEEQE